MDYAWLLFSFEGRINRAKYWLATLIILCCMIFVLVLLAALAAIFGIGGPLAINLVGISASIQFTDDDLPSKTSLFPQIVTIPMTCFFAWCYAAASIKRLHDRNKSGWWMIPFIVATGLYGQFGHWLAGSYLAVLLGFAVFIFFIWGLVEMYCLRGSPWTNRFGANPLPKAQTRSRGEFRTGLHTSSAWDQHSEIESVPYSAGPSPAPHVERGMIEAVSIARYQ
jgi:uncharacterized membrane protein YhaH (DUF805 family)